MIATTLKQKIQSIHRKQDIESQGDLRMMIENRKLSLTRRR